MKYQRESIDAGALADLMPEGAKLVKQPELPKQTWKKGTAKYTITDIRMLHPIGIHIIEELLKHMCLTGEHEMTFRIEKECTEEDLDIATDIAMGFGWDAKYRGGEYLGGKLVYSVTRDECEDGQRTITLRGDPENAQALQEYYVKKGEKDVSLQELVIAMCDAEKDRFQEMKEMLDI